MKEVLFYKKREDTTVQCGVCEQRCIITDGRRGICGVRENHKGKLEALNYGKTIAVAIDPIEKKPLYHFMPGTFIYSISCVGCNFRCEWCQNWDISQAAKPNKEVLGETVLPKEHIENCISAGCPSIAYTYTEPTMFVEYALEIMKLAAKKDIKNVWVSNGYMSEKTLETIIPYLDAINVDFKGPNDETYQRYCGGKAGPIMRNLKTLYKNNIHTEVTTLIVPGVNDDKKGLKFIAEFIAKEMGPEVPWHISRFFPAWKMQDTPITPIETLKEAESIGKKAGLKDIHIGNI